MHSHLLTTFLLLSTSLAKPLSFLTRSTEKLMDPSCTLAHFYKLAFNSTLAQWKEEFHSPNRQKCWEWCTDACTLSPDTFPHTNGESVSWKPACARHDFSWRNLKRLKAFDEENKKTADEHLRDGMIELCGTHNVCVDTAKHVYYPVVRKTDRPADEHNKWDEKEGAGKTNCSVFPGCCANHSDPEPCGKEPLPGQHKGDGSCAAH